jgi:polyhydroxyalkanoate synthesis regulator phasin
MKEYTMPIRSQAQSRLFRAVAHNPEIAKRTGIAIETAKEMIASTAKIKELPQHVETIVKGIEGQVVNNHSISHSEAVKIARNVSKGLSNEGARDPNTAPVDKRASSDSNSRNDNTSQRRQSSQSNASSGSNTQENSSRGRSTKNDDDNVKKMAEQMVQKGEIPHHRGRRSQVEEAAIKIAQKEMGNRQQNDSNKSSSSSSRSRQDDNNKSSSGSSNRRTMKR